MADLVLEVYKTVDLLISTSSTKISSVVLEVYKTVDLLILNLDGV